MTRKDADLRGGGPRCSRSPVLLGSLIGKCRGTSEKQDPKLLALHYALSSARRYAAFP
jgi:hypothetical protein